MIIPAAGNSVRMGEPKQLLEFEGQPVLSSLLEKLSKAVESTVLVTQKTFVERLHLVEDEQLQIIINENPATEMIDSIRMGLEAIQGYISPEDAILVEPVDQPGITCQDFLTCIDFWKKNSESIVIGSNSGQRGHPLIFPASLIEFVFSEVCDKGLNALPKKFSENVLRINLPSGNALQNFNRPEDVDFEK